jgi:hypothetical protein
MATIRFRRTNDYMNLMRDYSLFIDGQKIGTIGMGQTRDFEITNGQHTIIAKIDWCSSPELSFEINDNGSKTFLVGGFKNGNLIIPLIIIIFIITLLLPNATHSYYKLFLVLPPFLFLLYIVTLGRKNYLTLIEKYLFTA